MSEQKKMDAERAAFEAWWVSRPHRNHPEKFANGDYCAPSVHSAWGAWQARASLPVGVPDGERLAELLESVRLGDDEAKPHGSGATYWNNAVLACQVAIRDALSAAPTVKAEQVVMADAYVGAREDLAIWKRRALEAEQKIRHQEQIIDQLTLEDQGETRFGEPSLPSAGSAVNELDLFNEWFGREVWTDGCYGNPDILRRQLWPCWQARAALSAQQSAPEMVSVPVELLERIAGKGCDPDCCIAYWREQLRALLASHAEGGKV